MMTIIIGAVLVGIAGGLVVTAVGLLMADLGSSRRRRFR